MIQTESLVPGNDICRNGACSNGGNGFKAWATPNRTQRIHRFIKSIENSKAASLSLCWLFPELSGKVMAACRKAPK